MTWSKLSDDFSDDCWTLSNAAFRLHVDGIVWSNRKLLDLVIPKDDLRRFKTPEAIDELLAVGWWTEDGGDAYIIRHHGAYQRTREDVLKRQATSAANGRKGGRPPGREQARGLPSNPLGNPVANPADNPQGQDRTGQALDRSTYGLEEFVGSDTGTCRRCTGFELLDAETLCRDCSAVSA